MLVDSDSRFHGKWETGKWDGSMPGKRSKPFAILHKLLKQKNNAQRCRKHQGRDRN